MKATVHVRPKAGIKDPQGEAVRGSLAKSGFDIVSVRIGRVVDIELETADREKAQAELEQMSHDLLANPLVESYEIELLEES
ncbi:MAG TPA: phosphoribosylformylglycinamidine synthase subunit PurS [Gaiellaceae bacterium]